MAYYDLVFYCNAGDQSATGYYAVAKRPQNTAVVAGQLCRQFTAPAVGSERVFVCIVAGTTANVTDATWVLTRGAKTTDGTATWMECTGMAAVNGDATNTVNWTAAKAIAAPTLGAIIKRNSGASYQICTTAGAMAASEPAFSDTAGVTTTDGSAVWTSLGAIGNFTGGQAPHARLGNALAVTWFAAGNTVYVGDNHAESQTANISYNPVGSATAVSNIICHNHSGSYPPGPGALMAGASVTVTGASGTISLVQSGAWYFYGIAFRAGATSGGSPDLFVGGTANGWFYFDNCSLQLAETAGAGNGVIVLGGSGGGSTSATIILNNTTVRFGAAGDIIVGCLARIVWQNTGQILAAGSVVPAILLKTNANTNTVMSDYVLEALDLSQINTSLYSNVGNLSNCNVLIKDCKLNPAVTVTTPGFSGSSVQLVRSDSGATAYKSARYAFEGTETTETSITRVGGATDPTGQAQSRKIVTTANSQWLRPFKAEPYAIWNPNTGANVTVTVCGNAVTSVLPNNDDIWLEVEYLGSFLTGAIVNTTKVNLLAANAVVAADSSAWDNTAPARANTTAYAVGNAIKTASNPGRAFICTTAGTSGATENPSVTWSASDIQNMTLSGGNLIAQGASAAQNGVRSTLGQTTGKIYFELTVTGTMNSTSLGVATAAATFSGIYNAGTGASFANPFNGNTFDGTGTAGGNLGAFVSGDVLCVALDLTNLRTWFRKNNGNWNASGTANPATNTGGLSVSTLFSGSVAAYAVMSSQNSTTIVTANFGATSYTYSVPSGFAAWPLPSSPYTFATCPDGGIVIDGTATFQAGCRFKLATILGTGDPYWTNVKLLLGFEGVNGSIGAPGFTDESSAAVAGSLVGSTNTHIDTSQFKFGTSSLVVNNGSVTYPDNLNYALGSVPFTIEAWIRPTSVSGTQFIVAKFGSSAPNLGWVLYMSGTALGVNGSPDGTTNTTIMSGGTVATNVWQHVCADFDGAKYRLYLNGAMVASSTTLVSIFNPAKPLAVGANSDNAFIFSGNIDELRLTKGMARYASDSGFTVPAAAFPRVYGSVTPGMAGYLYARIRAAKPSTMYYIDPQVMLS